MEGPPATDGVFAAVTPVIEEVEEEEVGEESKPGSILKSGDDVFEVGGNDVVEAEFGVEGVDGGLKGDEKEDGEDTEAREEGIDDVDAGGGAVFPSFDREQSFERAQ